MVRLRVQKFSSFVEEYASNLSLGGMFLATRDIRRVGEEVGVEIALGDGFRLIDAVGEVVWVRSRDRGPGRPAGIAIRFRALDEQGRELILKILEEQVRSGGVPFEVEEVPPDAEVDAAVAHEPPAPDLVPTAASSELDFRAPWGEELPEIPQEILQDHPPSAPEAEAGAGSEEGSPGGGASPAVEPGAPPPARGSRARDGGVPEAEPAVHPAQAAVKAPGPAPQTEPDEPRLEVGPPAAELASMAGDGIGPDPAEDAPASVAPVAAPEPAIDRQEAPAPLPVPADPGPPRRSAPGPAPGTELPGVSGEILDYEADLFRGEARPRYGLGVAAGLVAVLLLLGAALAVPFRQPLLRLVGLAGAANAGEPGDVVAGPRPEALEPAPTSPPAGASAVAGETEAGESGNRGEPPPAAAAAAARVDEITWRSTASGTLVTFRLDGRLEAARVAHDPLGWAADSEQVTLSGIAFPYSPNTVQVWTPELRQIRTGLHVAGGTSELRMVFDFAVEGASITELRALDGLLQVLVERPPG